jgi:hypothetical protein
MLVRTGFEPVMDMERITLTYGDAQNAYSNRDLGRNTRQVSGAAWPRLEKKGRSRWPCRDERQAVFDVQIDLQARFQAARVKISPLSAVGVEHAGMLRQPR